jgi:hypothetical protein
VPHQAGAAAWTQLDVQDWLLGLHIDQRDIETLTSIKDGPLRNGLFLLRASIQNVAEAFGNRKCNEQAARVVQDAILALQKRR